MAAIGLKTHIWDNNFRSLLLLGLYPLFLIGMLWLVAFLLRGFLAENANQIGNVVAFANAFTKEWWWAPFLFTMIWFCVSWFFHGMLVRAVVHSHPVTRADEPELYNLLENLCISCGMTIPKLEIIETHARNAFASGLTDSTYTITVTRGLLQSLKLDEVEGVLAHELTHIINRDVRLLMVCVVFTGMLGFLAQVMWSNARYGIRVRRSGSNRGGGTLIYFIILLVLWIGYMASLLARFAISRAREYMADAGAIELTRNPDAMMRALLRISGRANLPHSTDDIALMCIENARPFMGLFTTHPPIDSRVAAISRLTSTPVPDIGPHAPAAHEERFQSGAKAQNSWLTRNRFGRSSSPWEGGGNTDPP